MSRANLDLVLAHYEDRRSELNRKAAWCCVIPPLGWFGRADRIEAEHARVNKIIHDTIRVAYAPAQTDTRAAHRALAKVKAETTAELRRCVG